MKITKVKTVETITQEVIVIDGTYYFSYGYNREEPYEYYKVAIENQDLCDTFASVEITKVRNCYEDFLISNRVEVTNELDIKIKWYFIKEWNQGEQEIKEITYEEFEKQKKNVLEIIKRV